MIFLSKEGEDEYINMFASGCKQYSISTDDFAYDISTEPIVLRGILKHNIMKIIRTHTQLRNFCLS